MDGMVEPLRASSDVNAAPDWSVVPFAVNCARCGHDLHGQSEPTCPGCALTFRWADAVPIEQLTCMSCGYHLYGLKDQRCPECGVTFTWDEALASYHRQRKPLFEYQWRTKPVRSLFYTWWMAMRPKKLWNAVEIHDPVRVWPLVWFALIASFLIAIAVWVAFARRTYQVISDQYPGSWERQIGGISFLDFLSSNLWQFVSFWLIVVIVAYLLMWMASVMVGLLVFQQSMFRLRIRFSHIVRVAAFASIPFWFGMALIGSLIAVLDPPVWYPGIVQRRPVGFEIPILIISLLYSLLSISLAYRDYLRMDHPWAVGISASAIALLLTLAIAIPIDPSSIGLAALQLITETIGLF